LAWQGKEISRRGKSPARRWRTKLRSHIFFRRNNRISLPCDAKKIHWPKADFVLRSLHKLPIPTKTPALAIVPLSGKMRTAEGRRSTEGAQYPSQGQRPWNRGFQLRRSRNAAK
jgi:hypothetical protein